MRNFDDAVAPERPAAQQTLPQRIGAGIRSARKRKKLTLSEVATRCGTTPQTVQRLETANMTLSVEWIERLCGALDVDPAELFVHYGSAPMRLYRRRTEVCEEIEVLAVKSQRFVAALERFVAEFGEDASKC